MKRDNKVYLDDILEAIGKCEIYTSGMDFDEFYEDEPVRILVVHYIQTIGEAAGRLTSEFKKRNSEFPIREAKSMRNKIIHEYDLVDYKIVWKVLKEDLPLLKHLAIDALKK